MCCPGSGMRISPLVKEACQRALAGIEYILSDGVELAMSRVNGKAQSDSGNDTGKKDIP